MSANHPAWVWNVLKGITAYVEFDIEATQFPGYFITNIGQPRPEMGKARLFSEGNSLDEIRGSRILVSDKFTPLVRNDMVETVFSSIPEKIIIETIIQTEFGDTVEGFSYVKPTTICDCLDLVRTDGDLIDPPGILVNYDRIHLRTGCLSGHHFSRDKLTKQIIVSNSFKECVTGHLLNENSFYR